MLIVFEGLDGAGKDTQLRKVFEYISSNYKYTQIMKTQEPSGISKEGIAIRKKLQGEGFSSPREALNLYIEDRCKLNILKSNFVSQGVILSSRGDYTTYAYQSLDQGSNKGFSFDEIYNTHRELEKNNNTKLLIPDITFYFDLSIDNTMDRINERLGEGEKKDFFENKLFLEKARYQYLKAIEYLKEKEDRNIYIIDASQSIEDIYNEVISHLEDFNRYYKFLD